MSTSLLLVLGGASPALVDEPLRLEVGGTVVGEVTDDSSRVDTTALDEGYSSEPVVGVRYALAVEEAGAVTVELVSYAFDAYLVVRGEGGEVLAEDDDGRSGTHARVVLELGAGAVVGVEACALHGGRGAFELRVEGGAPGERTRAAVAELVLEDALGKVAHVEGTAPGTFEHGAACNEAGVELYYAARYGEALEHFERGYAIFEAVLEPDDPDLLSAMGNLGVIRLELGDGEGARVLLERALELEERVSGPAHPDTAHRVRSLGALHYRLGDDDAARLLYERALAIREEALGPDHRLVAESLEDVASVVEDREVERKLAYLERALAIRERTEPESRTTARALRELGNAVELRGDHERARALLERGLAVALRARGPDHPDAALVGGDLGRVLLALGEVDAAREHLERALTVFEATRGPDHERVAKLLLRLVNLEKDAGDYELELAHAERALGILEATHGPDHVEVAAALRAVASARLDLGLPGHLELLRRALALEEAAYGPDGSELRYTLLKLARSLEERRDWAEARRTHERALAIVEATLGPDHRETAVALSNFGDFLRQVDEHEAALALYERALPVVERWSGPEHPEFAAVLDNVGALYQDLNQPGRALEYSERALALRERILPPKHPDVAHSLHNVGTMLLDDVRPAEGRPYLERALELRLEILGPEHPLTASTQHSLGTACFVLDELGAARRHLERALAVDEAVYGPDDPRAVSILNALAALSERSGDPETAVALYRRALERTERVLGPDDPVVAIYLGNLGGTLEERGDPATARRMYERALAICEATLGPEHEQTADALHDLGGHLVNAGELERARPLLERSLALTGEIFGAEHPETVGALRGLAWLHEDAGDLDRAIELVGRMHAIEEAAYGPENRRTVGHLSYLGRLHADRGELDEAWELARRAGAARIERIARQLFALSDGDRFGLLAQDLDQLEQELSIAFACAVPGAERAAYEAVLGWKGLVGRVVLASRAQLLRDAGDAERELVGKLRATRSQLASQALELDVADRASHDRRTAELRGEVARLERELAGTVSTAGRPASAGFDDVRAALPGRSALVDFFAHGVRRLGRVDGSRWEPERVTAWITRPDASEPVRLDLGRASELEAAIRAYLEDLVARRGMTVVAEDAEDAEDAGAALRELLWDPIAAHLDAVDTVFVSPDGALGTLPFETLPLADGSLAIERFAFVYLQDATALARRPSGEGGAAELDSLLAVGGVDFRERATWELAEAAVEPRPGALPGDAALRGSFTDYWGRLPATAYEAQVVVDMHADAFDPDGRRLLLQGGEPSERRLKHELERHAVLHLATHGYFQPEGLPSMWEAAKDAAGRTELRLSDEARHLVGKHPGLLSGLVCAGANRADDTEEDDGYLTAEEGGWLDLADVELVVLSACETGLGRPQSGEGLIGLRRAFRTAGAKTVISSLWSVKDESTADLMRDFYKNLFLRGMDRHESLRAAQLAMLRRNRMEHGEALPSTWGAFVLSGKWR